MGWAKERARAKEQARQCESGWVGMDVPVGQAVLDVGKAAGFVHLVGAAGKGEKRG